MNTYSIDDVTREFPDAERILSFPLEEPDLPRKFVSIFDRWLGKENYGQLDCKNDAERAERNERLLSHWEMIFERTPVFMLNETGVLTEAVNRESFFSKCEYGGWKGSADFVFVLLPALGAYYQEHWDDTNVVWYSDIKKAQPLFDWAIASGLHTLEDRRENTDSAAT